MGKTKVLQVKTCHILDTEKVSFNGKARAAFADIED